MKVLDIGSSESVVSKKISNFTAFDFFVDDVFCASMEGFLQSLKFKEEKKQIEICKLIGKKAKFKGKKKKWYKDQILYWKGKEVERNSQEYQDLLDKAFSSLFKNEEFKNILKQTKGYKLTHSIGKDSTKETVLTVEEFCERLEKLRYYVLKI